MPSYSQRFEELSGHAPWGFQSAVAEALFARRNVVVSAPTGLGKTFAALAPFLLDRGRIGVTRLIYVLPLRTLVNSIHEQASELAGRFGLEARIQTGETPGDPFYEADITVTTYDQLLSGLLGAPYSLAGRLYNMNCAAIAGALVVFDEFHLMEPDKAFATAASMLGLFRRHSRSVWMTATATEPLKAHLERTLDAVRVEPSSEELAHAYRGRGIERRVRKRDEVLGSAHLREYPGTRRLAVVNQVAVAQELFRELRQDRPEDVDPENIVLLHARLFASDRRERQARLQKLFGKDARGSAIAIATQVVEAGIDISAEHLYTEVSPVNSLVQRAGRCARFAGQRGIVHVFRDPRGRPYSRAEQDHAWAALEDGSELSPESVALQVDAAHRDRDREAVKGAMKRDDTCGFRIRSHMEGARGHGVGELIRSSGDNVRLLILDDPAKVIPASREAISVYRTQLGKIEGAGGRIHRYDPDVPDLWFPCGAAEPGLIYAVSRAGARYDESGLLLGEAGERESPVVTLAARDWASYRAETWLDHSLAVAARAATLLKMAAPPGSLLAEAEPDLAEALRAAAEGHDLGKLQAQWQEWARSYQLGHGGAVSGEALAHTDWTWNNPEHRRAEREARPVRPPHAFASAWYLRRAIRGKPWEIPVLAAILTHHGGWQAPPSVGGLCPSAGAAMKACGFTAAAGRPPNVRECGDLLQAISEFIEGEFETKWPLIALLMRMVRLADQKATREAGSGE